MNNQPTIEKLGFSFYSANAGKSLELARSIYAKSKVKSRAEWAKALKSAWNRLRVEHYLELGRVVFYKESTALFTKNSMPEIRVANIVSVVGITPYSSGWSSKHEGLFMAVDIDKMRNEKKSAKESIISFYAQNVLH